MSYSVVCVRELYLQDNVTSHIFADRTRQSNSSRLNQVNSLYCLLSSRLKQQKLADIVFYVSPQPMAKGYVLYTLAFFLALEV